VAAIAARSDLPIGHLLAIFDHMLPQSVEAGLSKPNRTSARAAEFVKLWKMGICHNFTDAPEIDAILGI
jgi:hypothetical protein